MDCIWIFNINNCNQEIILKNIVISGIILLTIILILYIFVILFKIYKRKWNGIIKNGKIQYGILSNLFYTFIK